MAGKRRFDEQAVFNVAMEVLERRGYKEATMVELAEATGVQRGALYDAYGSKEEFFLRAFNYLAGKFYEQVRRALTKPDRRACLQSFFKLIVPRGNTSRCVAIIATRLTTESGDPSHRLRDSLAEFFVKLENLLCEALSVERDGMELSMSADDAAKLVVATTRGIAVMRNIRMNRVTVTSVTSALLNAVISSAPQDS
ncbi:TetR/AcrR family transcriptional regulator [Paraburkholderia sp. LEh10]|uniref:TetR/AcrR family transcriptional regulator n=1 Tax=Paraburkholderia sp. LEh10 TaxID=2821353 RepID=UPI001AE9C1B1|nr:TetR/AcrR family transcriptional regulator [Paraburkholderia sp. LEh10]MBP0594185.1 TetR/AcrR family transcriptional regulator [Paraburkholderia sp. LEh10]